MMFGGHFVYASIVLGLPVMEIEHAFTATADQSVFSIKW